MTFIVENGGGIYGANSGVAHEFVTTYLTERGRETDNSWDTATDAEKESACIASTQYVDVRFNNRFLGIKAFVFEGAFASASIQFTGVPAADDTVTIGYTTYIMSGAAINVADAADELVTLIEDAADQIIASATSDTVDTVLVELSAAGESGNYTPLSASDAPATVTLTSFSGGEERGEQRVSFPRNYIYDSYGNTRNGMPLEYLWALSEYASRAHASTLMPDPEIDDSGKTIVEKSEQVGPIIESIKFSEGGAVEYTIRPYPEADKLLAPLLKGSGGGVFR